MDKDSGRTNGLIKHIERNQGETKTGAKNNLIYLTRTGKYPCKETKEGQVKNKEQRVQTPDTHSLVSPLTDHLFLVIFVYDYYYY